jgi:O-antigen/teichoic acid export membrane protein
MRNVSTNWLTLFLNIVIFYLLTPYIIEKLGIDIYGIWVLIVSITTFIQLMDFGMAGALRRFISHHEARNETLEITKVISNVFFIYSVTAIFVAIIVILMYFYLLPIFEMPSNLVDIAKKAFLIAGLDIAFVLFFNLYAGTLWALQRFDLTNYGLIATTILRTILIVIVLDIGMGLTEMALAILATNLLYHLYKMYMVHKVCHGFKITLGLISRNELVSLAKFSGIGFLTSLSNLGIRNSSPIIVGLFLNSASVAYFAISQSLVNYAAQIIGSASGVTGPAISRQNSLSNHDSNKNLLLHGQKYTAYVSFLIGFGLILFGEKFIELWVGFEFSQKAYGTLVLLSIAGMFSLPQSIAHNYLFNTNKHLLNAKITLSLFILSTILQIALAGVAGLEGIAMGFLIAHSLVYIFIIPKIICKSIDITIRTYLGMIYVKPLLLSLPFIVSAICFKFYFGIDTFSNLILFASVTVVFHLASIYTWGTSAKERKAFWKLILR